jgi:sodium transport system permease protein
MWLIFKKELLELVRDRKVLFFMVALPLLIFPLLIGVMIYFTGEVVSDVQSKTLTYAVSGEEHAPALMAELAKVDTLELVVLDKSIADEDEAKEAVRQGEVDFVLQIPSNYNNNILSAGQITINIVLNDSRLNSARSRLLEITDDIEESNKRVAYASLQVNELMQEALEDPIVVKRVNVADTREQAGSIFGGMVPYVLFILILQGAMLPAADIGAGEKERGTLETLLLSPVPRINIVLAKFLTIGTAGVTTALVTILSVALWGLVGLQFIPSSEAIDIITGFMSSIGLLDFLLMFLMLVPVVATFASLLLTLSIYARSFKEAQGYMTPLIVLMIFPVLLAIIPGIELKGVWAWIPLTNVALAIKELIKGTMDYVQLVGIFASSVILAGALLAFCVYWFNQEKVLFR